MSEIEERNRRRISGFVEVLAARRSDKRAGRSRSDFINGLLNRAIHASTLPGNDRGPAHRILVAIFLGAVLSGCAAHLGNGPIESLNIVPLVTTLDEGVADSQAVPVRFEDKKVWLALDTGAPFTFLFSDPAGPEYVEDSGTIEIGCETRRVPAYRDEAIGVEMFRGKPIVGVLGLDFFLDVPAEIDYPGSRLVRHLDGRVPEGDKNLPGVPLHGRDSGRALVDVVLDGKKIVLMLDTGAHDTILIDTAGGKDDEIGMVQTADGRKWKVRVGEATLSLPGEARRTVPVMRAPDLRYISPELRGISARGLFGLTSLGWRRVIFDFAGGVLRLGPLGGLPKAPGNTDHLTKKGKL